VWQWDAQASERRELATKKAELATAKKFNLSKCKPGNCQSYYRFVLMNVVLVWKLFFILTLIFEQK
jgi:hypothetical protein